MKKELRQWLAGIAGSLLVAWLGWVSLTLVQLSSDVAVLKNEKYNSFKMTEKKTGPKLGTTPLFADPSFQFLLPKKGEN